MIVRDVLAEVERLAPPHFAFGFDHVGLQVGDPEVAVSRIAVSLDSGIGAIEFAAAVGAEVLVCHHPVIWEPLVGVCADDWGQRRVFELVKRGISLIAAHTNWDCAPGGINDVLADRLGLDHLTAFGSAEKEAMWKLVVFAPLVERDRLLDALSEAGAGVIGAYDRCAFFNEGTGTFFGGEGSKPVVGQSGRIEQVAEVRIEMQVRDHCKHAVESALYKNHVYEEPAFDWVRLADGIAHRAGRIGSMREVDNFQAYVDERLESRSEMWVGHDRAISRVAVVGGAASGEWRAALAAGADAFITGEVPQHVGLEASESGMTIMACGHYATEQPGMVEMAKQLRQRLSIPVEIYVPDGGLHGHPK